MSDPSAVFDPEDVQVRLADVADHRAIVELYGEGLLEGQLRENDTGADIENLTEGYFSDEGASAFWVACVSSDVIGMIGVQKTREDAAEVRRLRVTESHRRRGVGSLLLREATDFCRSRAYLKVVLDVRIERGPAIAMFKKFGFSLARTREHGERTMLDFYLDLYRDRNE